MAAPAAENEHRTTERVQLQVLRDHGGEPIEAATHIGDAGREPNLHARRRRDHPIIRAARSARAATPRRSPRHRRVHARRSRVRSRSLRTVLARPVSQAAWRSAPEPAAPPPRAAPLALTTAGATGKSGSAKGHVAALAPGRSCPAPSLAPTPAPGTPGRACAGAPPRSQSAVRPWLVWQPQWLPRQDSPCLRAIRASLSHSRRGTPDAYP